MLSGHVECLVQAALCNCAFLWLTLSLVLLMPHHCFFVSGQVGSPLGQGELTGCAVLGAGDIGEHPTATQNTFTI